MPAPLTVATPSTGAPVYTPDAACAGPPTNKDQCMKGGWATFTTPEIPKNQGDCVSYVEKGKNK